MTNRPCNYVEVMAEEKKDVMTDDRSPVRFPIEAGHIMMFARAIRDPNPIYSDADYAIESGWAGVLAPPTFVAAGAQFDPDYPLRPKVDRVDRPWMGSGRNASSLRPNTTDTGSDSSGDSRSLLHAEQHYEYHAPLTAGMVLTATHLEGNTWTKEGRRGGTLKFHESITEYRDETGQLIVTARNVGVHTGRVVEQTTEHTPEQTPEQTAEQTPEHTAGQPSKQNG